METDHRLKDRRGAGCWSASVEACREVVCVCLYLSTRGRQHTEDHCAMVMLCLHVCVSLLEPDGVTLLILLVCWASEVDEPDRSVGPALCVCERLSGGTVVALSLCWLHLSHSPTISLSFLCLSHSCCSTDLAQSCQRTTQLHVLINLCDEETLYIRNLAQS